MNHIYFVLQRELPRLQFDVAYMNRYQRIWLLMQIVVGHIAGSILKLHQARHRYAEVGDHITVSAIGGALTADHIVPPFASAVEFIPGRTSIPIDQGGNFTTCHSSVQ